MLDVLAVSKRKEQRKFPSKLWWENNFDQKYQKFARLWQRVLFFSHDTFAKCTMSYYVLHHVQPLSLTLFSMTLSSEWCASRFRILKEFVWAGKKVNAVLRRIIYYEHLQTHLSVRPCPKYNLSYAYQKLALIANPSSKSQPLQSPQSLQTKFTSLFVLLLRWLKM